VVLDFLKTRRKYVLGRWGQYSEACVSTPPTTWAQREADQGQGSKGLWMKLQEEEGGCHSSAQHRGAMGHLCRLIPAFSAEDNDCNEAVQDEPEE
jgi:hypothetical protein